jgi:hypothetical protein
MANDGTTGGVTTDLTQGQAAGDGGGLGAGQGTVTTQGAGATPQDGTDGVQAQGTEASAQEGQAQKAQAPEAYEINLPEGTGADPAAVQAFSALAQEMSLSQENVNKLVDFAAKQHMIGGAVEAQEAFEVELNRKVAAWGEEVRRDPELGGVHLNENAAVVRRAISQLGGPELEEALTRETGLINHPQVWRAFVKMGRMMREDRFVTGSPAAPSGAGRSPMEMARAVYPNMRHN